MPLEKTHALMATAVLLAALPLAAQAADNLAAQTATTPPAMPKMPEAPLGNMPAMPKGPQGAAGQPGAMPMMMGMPEMCQFEKKDGNKVNLPCDMDGMKKTKKMSPEDMQKAMMPPPPPAMGDMPKPPALPQGAPKVEAKPETKPAQ